MPDSATAIAVTKTDVRPLSTPWRTAADVAPLAVQLGFALEVDVQLNGVVHSRENAAAAL
jgi:hypothetical protein